MSSFGYGFGFGIEPNHLLNLFLVATKFAPHFQPSGQEKRYLCMCVRVCENERTSSGRSLTAHVAPSNGRKHAKQRLPHAESHLGVHGAKPKAKPTLRP